MILKVTDLKVLTTSGDQNIKSFKWVMWGIKSKVFGDLVSQKDLFLTLDDYKGC